MLKEYWLEILAALATGSFGSLVIIHFAGKVVGMDDHSMASILLQAATTAIAISISQTVGGTTFVTAFTVVFNGVLTYTPSWIVLRWSKINSPIAKSLALGAVEHALGTVVGIGTGETEAATASISVVVTDVAIVLVVLFFVTVIGL